LSKHQKGFAFVSFESSDDAKKGTKNRIGWDRLSGASSSHFTSNTRNCQTHNEAPGGDFGSLDVKTKARIDSTAKMLPRPMDGLLVLSVAMPLSITWQIDWDGERVIFSMSRMASHWAMLLFDWHWERLTFLKRTVNTDERKALIWKLLCR
jgi:hypothetical protein